MPTDRLDRTHSPGDIVGWLKAMTTNEYMNGVRQGVFALFDKKLWQRIYYEHIIRDEDDLFEIRRYISEKRFDGRLTGKNRFEKEDRV